MGLEDKGAPGLRASSVVAMESGLPATGVSGRPASSPKRKGETRRRAMCRFLRGGRSTGTAGFLRSQNRLSLGTSRNCSWGTWPVRGPLGGAVEIRGEARGLRGESGGVRHRVLDRETLTDREK
ncbi:MAG: hypothetical protein BJ554DRAFT_5414 [Olpidium bornovanus]|uniref:Uncharacterized protein n=1 Tax=Olpidium bornovanus TaxID=278681 RepID=A0A8H7ZZ91_9FUNG|nr:MAG: hypothetical protein BJ554DRAFT_5414 [Olpidium bornovanus]